MTQQDVLDSSGRFPKRARLADDHVRANATETARRVTMLLTSFASVAKENHERRVTSGFRDTASNAKAKGKPHSAHLFGMAVDVEDSDGKLKKFCEDNEDLLQHFALWMERGSFTPTWCHLQIRPVASGSHIFDP